MRKATPCDHNEESVRELEMAGDASVPLTLALAPYRIVRMMLEC